MLTAATTPFEVSSTETCAASLKENRLASLAVQQVNPLEHPGWDSLLAAHPNASLFHGAAWAKVLQDAYGYSPVYFAAHSAGTLRSLLPIMEVDSWLTGRRGVALPFTDNCEPLCADAGSFQNLFQRAIEFGKERKWKYLECRGGRKWLDGVPPSLSFYGHSLDLAGDEETLFARLDGSTRRAVRKAEKSGVTVAVSQGLDAMRTFYSLQCKTRRKHGIPPQSFNFFRKIHEHVIARNMGVVVIACSRKTPIAASIYFCLAGRAIYKYGASDERFQHLRGTNLVMWEAIKWHARNNAKTLHLGRTSIANEGLRRFKLGWGAEEQKIEYVKFDLREDRFVMDTDESSAWYNRAFNIMPLFLSRMIGVALYRHWA